MSTDLEPYRREAQLILADLADRLIESEEENAAVGALLQTVKARLSFLEDEKEKITAPQRAALEATRTLFKSVAEPFVTAEKLIKERMAQYYEARRLKEAEVLEAALAQGAASRALVDLASQAAPVVQGVSMRTAYEARIVNPDLVPDEYWVIDEKRVAAVVRAARGSIVIPGVEVVKKTTVAASKG